MHETVFDHLSRSMGAGVSRREMVRVVAGGALSLGLGHLALDDADAKKHGRHRKKRRRRADDGSTSDLAPTPPVPSDPGPVTCPAGTFRLEDRCARGCDAGCAGGACFTTIEDVPFCGPVLDSCAAIPIGCSSHEQCGAQEFCAATFCFTGDVLSSRCVPIQA